MTQQEQTDQVKVQLYELTSQFVRKYQPLYFYQYDGEIEDLVSEFYLQFLTAKSREEGKEQSLLDKFDSKITTLPYLVKVSVQRMLIDRSRQWKYKESIDEQCDEFGDLILKRYSLMDSHDSSIDDFDYTPKMVETALQLWWKKSDSQRRALRKAFTEVKLVINPKVAEFLSKVMVAKEVINEFFVDLVSGGTFRVYQLTDKSIQLIQGDEIVTYNRQTGVARGKLDYVITPKSLQSFLGSCQKSFKLKSIS